MHRFEESSLRTVLYDAAILVEYSFHSPDRAISVPGNWERDVAVKRLITTNEAVELFRTNRDQERAIAYTISFSISRPSQIIKCVNSQVGMEEEASRLKRASPKALISATAANELLIFILADPGDALLVPIPYYPGFDRDLRWRTGVKIVPIHCDSSNNFQVTPQALEAAYKDAEAMNIKVRGVLITNPSNPLGATIQRSVLEDILDFATQKNIHLVSDEIYSGSTFSSSEFVSIAEILEARGYKDSERVHIVYSLSKDLGLPGFRVGTIYSYNDKVVTTARKMSSFTLISSQTQHLLATMLSDKVFTKNYIKINRERLRKRYEMIIQGLRSAGIECLKGNAGLFCWMNLSPLLKTPTKEGELSLWNSIIHDLKLNISPGSSCHCSEPGWFRVCFANMSEQTLEVALKRIHNFMEQKKTETN
ncbi:hypothetical protein GH714_026584 [Hevea brasiliensis]|uniref:1-aminocyclopropane-1-carboxylate synthase n=1 Tax=Hevea brasiliensis TaxID=3981 RepID=A0A6A6LWK5_HEVBR|nr:hypothetical protein GH714_026584 [Hevea brasiliensis]